MALPAPNPPDGDDDEYELEDVDQEVTEHARRQAKEEMRRANAAIDVDEIYRELDHRDDFDDAFNQLKARFSLKSLLWLMTAVAMLLGLVGSGFFSSGAVFAAIIAASVVGLGGAHAWLNYRERLRREELIAKRERQLRDARRMSGAADGDPLADEAIESSPEPARAFGSVASGLRLDRRLGVGELLVAVAVAAAIVFFLSLVGSPARGAAALAAIAVLGFAVQAAEVRVARSLILAWWLALAGYCVLTLLSALASAAGFAVGG